MRNYAAEAEALMLELVAHPGGVADALRILGVRGRPGAPCECPLAIYLASAMGLPLGDVVVGFIVVKVSDAPAVPNTSPIATFIAKFDSDAYPELYP